MRNTFFAINTKFKIKLSVSKILFFILLSLSTYAQKQNKNIFLEFKYDKNQSINPENYCSSIFLYSAKHFLTAKNNYTIASINFNIPFKNTAIGGFISKKIFPQNILNIQNFAFAYQYKLKLNNRKKLSFTLTTSLHQWFLNTKNLIFSSMIDPLSDQIQPINELFLSQKQSALSFSFASVYFKKNSFLTMLSVNNFGKNINTLLLPSYNLILRKNLYINKLHQNIINFYLLTTYKKNILDLELGIEKSYKNWQLTVITINHFNKYFIFGTYILVSYNIKNLFFSYSTRNYLGSWASKYGTLNSLSIKIYFPCKKSINNTINCPAYQL